MRACQLILPARNQIPSQQTLGIGGHIGQLLVWYNIHTYRTNFEAYRNKRRGEGGEGEREHEGERK